MPVDYEVQRCTRLCAATGRPLAEGEEVFSALVAEGRDVVRRDYAAEAWSGPPERAIGWWKSRLPTVETRRSRMAPSEVLLQLFRELEGIADQQDLRYVLALLLIRRRVLKSEEHEGDQGELTLYCPRDETTHRVHSKEPGPDRIAEIQAELSRLLAR